MFLFTFYTWAFLLLYPFAKFAYIDFSQKSLNEYMNEHVMTQTGVIHLRTAN